VDSAPHRDYDGVETNENPWLKWRLREVNSGTRCSCGHYLLGTLLHRKGSDIEGSLSGSVAS
jgi:hypothetical protein